MTDTNFVSELLRAANAIGKLSPEQVGQLLYRSVVLIRDLRGEIGIPGSGTSKDAVIGLTDVAARSDTASNHERRAALLDAVDMIRTLRIVAESEVKLVVRETAEVPGT